MIQASDASVSVNFLLRNFVEMNKLWTRMQRNTPPSESRDRARRVRLLLHVHCCFACVAVLVKFMLVRVAYHVISAYVHAAIGGAGWQKPVSAV